MIKLNILFLNLYFMEPNGEKIFEELNNNIKKNHKNLLLISN